LLKSLKEFLQKSFCSAETLLPQADPTLLALMRKELHSSSPWLIDAAMIDLYEHKKERKTPFSRMHLAREAIDVFCESMVANSQGRKWDGFYTIIARQAIQEVRRAQENEEVANSVFQGGVKAMRKMIVESDLEFSGYKDLFEHGMILLVDQSKERLKQKKRVKIT